MPTKLLTTLMLAAGLFLAFMHSPVYADGITVTTAADSDTADGDCSLREAIVAANTDLAYNGCSKGSGADTITFAGDYTITLAGSQLPVITSPVTINGNGPANTIIQANAAPDTATNRVFEVDAAGNLTLDNVTVQHGRCAGACPTVTTWGGGIYNAGALAVSNSNILSNTATSRGGAIYNTGVLTVTSSLVSHNKQQAIYADNLGQSTVISNSQIINNSSNSEGGGISAEHPLTVTNSLIGYNTSGSNGGGIDIFNTEFLIEQSDIISNTNLNSEAGGINSDMGSGTIRHSRVLSNSAPGSWGGGVYVDGNNGQVTIETSEIAYNAGTHGGGVGQVASSQLSLQNVFIHHNQATTGQGGGIFMDNTNNPVLTMTGTTIAYNMALSGEGGGMYVSTNHLPSITNSTISHNQAQKGGGIYANTGSVNFLITLTHVSLISNTATISGGGLHLYDVFNTGPIVRITLQNSLIAHNSGGDCARQNGWEELDATPGYNLDSDGTCVTDGVDNNRTSATPGIGSLADNDGITLNDGTVISTHALLTGSPAIDVIPPGSCPLNTDQRGVSRPQGDNCDIGAFELESGVEVYLPIVVKNN